MSDIIIVAGPNGAGKTSFARELLGAALGTYSFVNADEIARTLRTADAEAATVNVAAARVMLKKIDTLTTARRDVMFETTLATLIYRHKIPNWQSAGYSVGLIYLRLPVVETAIARVARRVAAGGHDIPEATIRQRFIRSLDYLDKHYKHIVDEWQVYDSLEGKHVLAESRSNQ